MNSFCGFLPIAFSAIRAENVKTVEEKNEFSEFVYKKISKFRLKSQHKINWNSSSLSLNAATKIYLN